MTGIGSLYNVKGVVVGQAAGFYGAESTPLPADVATVFDEATWSSSTLTIAGATGGTFTLSVAGGPVSGIATTAPIAFGAIGSAIKTALDLVLPSGVVSIVTPTGSTGPFKIAFVGSAASQIALTASAASLTPAPPTASAVVAAPLWTPAGATEQGWQSNYNPQTQDINIEEQQTPVARNVTTSTFDFTANLSEDSIANLQRAISATLTVTASDMTHFGVSELALQQTLPVIAVALETKNRFGLPRRYYVPGATCAVNVGQQFARARIQHLIPVTFVSVCNTSDIKVRDLTAVPG